MFLRTLGQVDYGMIQRDTGIRTTDTGASADRVIDSLIESMS